MNNNEDNKGKLDQPKLYTIRWFILLLFCSFSFLNAYQWIHLNIVSDRIVFLWNNSLPDSKTNREVAISWFSMVYMIAYIPFIIPAMWFLENQGLRRTSIVASFLNALGAWIKCFSINVDGTGFPLLMAAQAVCGIGQVFLLSVPARLAAVWFGVNEVSTATSLGVFGNQLGIGFGFAIPSYIIPPLRNNSTMEFFAFRFKIMFYTGASIMTFVFILVCVFFRNQPPTAPSWSQIMILKKSHSVDYVKSFKAISQNMDFMLLVISYGVNTGSFYAISTLLNSMLLHFFKDDTHLIGTAGFILILSGVIAAAIIGIIMDRTKQYKKITLIVYICSTLSMGAFSGGVYLYSWPIVFLVIFLLGFFMTGYLPIGFEIAAEMTFPINEGLSSGLINLAAQVLGLIYTYVGTLLLDSYGVLLTNMCFFISLIGGSILTAFMKVNQKRQQANMIGSEIQVLDESIINESSYQATVNEETTE